MGDHDTWWTLLPWWHALESWAFKHLGRDWTWWIFQSTEFSLVHVAGALLVCCGLLWAAACYRRTLGNESGGVVPSSELGLGTLLDAVISAGHSYTADVLGEEDARDVLPFMGTLMLFILCCNLQGLIPGFAAPTSSFKTNAPLAVSVFIYYNARGVRRHGIRYLLQFAGPLFPIGRWRIPILFWLIGPIEIISHLVRPFSLAVRLTVNLVADHKVVTTFAGILAVLVPVPFLLLGTLVAVVQAGIFVLLSAVYIGMAIQEEH